MATHEDCRCASPEYHRAKIAYKVGPMPLVGSGRWCTKCGDLIPDLRFPLKQIVDTVLRFRGEIEARADCVEHEHGE